MPFGRLPRPDTELVILRVAWRCGSVYEWRQHVPLGLRIGLTADQITAIADVIELCLLVGHYQGLASAIGGLAIEPETTQSAPGGSPGHAPREVGGSGR